MEKIDLENFLKTNIYVFACNAYDVSGINPRLACHLLNLNPEAMPRKQPPRRSSKDHVKAVRTEVNKLKQAGAMKEIFYLEWLANIVVVKKKNVKWQVVCGFYGLEKILPEGPLHYS